MFRGSMKSTGYPLHSPVSPSIPLPCVTVCHHISTGLYINLSLPPLRADCLEIWESQPPGNFRACPGLYTDFFTFLLVFCSRVDIAHVARMGTTRHPRRLEVRPVPNRVNVGALRPLQIWTHPLGICKTWKTDTLRAHQRTCDTLLHPRVASVEPGVLGNISLSKNMYTCPCFVQCYAAHPHVNNVLTLWYWQRHFLCLCIRNTYIYCIVYYKLYIYNSGPGSPVGIVTDYGLDGPGSNPGGDEIFHPCGPGLGPTQPPVKWVPGLSRG